VGFILHVGSVALATAVLPYFSKMVSAQDWQELRNVLKSLAVLIIAISIPVAAVLIYFSEPIIRLVFERGAFESGDTVAVAAVQAVYALQIPFFTIGIMLARLLSALQNNQILFWSSFINLILNVVLNFILMQYLDVVGIALSTSLVYMFSFGFLMIMAYLKLKKRAAAMPS